MVMLYTTRQISSAQGIKYIHPRIPYYMHLRSGRRMGRKTVQRKGIMRIKVMIASNDGAVCEQLKSKGAFPYNKMEVLAWVKTGEEIFERFQEANPRLLIIDKNIGGMDAAACIKRVHEIKPKCRILVIGDREDSAFMRELFRLKVAGYLAKPVDAEELNTELCMISEDIRRVTLEAINYDTSISMQSLYFWKLMFEDSDLARDIKFANRTLECYFKEGYFRVVLFKIDKVQGELPNFQNVKYYDELHAIQQYVKATVSRHIYEYCFEMLFDFRFNGVLAVINYDPESDQHILDGLEEMTDSIYRYAILNYGLTVTICVGNACDDFTKVRQSREEAYSAAWSRMKHGTGKILYYRKKYDSQQVYQERLEQIVEDLKLTADTLDVEEFHKTVEELFSLPDYTLTDYRSRDFILSFVDEFFSINRMVLSKYIKLEQEKENIKKTLNFSHTLESYRNNFVNRFEELFGLLAADAEKQNIRLLRKAVKYIKENYDKPLTAEILAELVNLSPVYFSYLFKKNIGVNMTDYITEYRMEIAKKLLFETEMSVYEIAVTVGFQDQRYFSKRFKHIVGKTPTEYRKMK